MGETNNNINESDMDFGDIDRLISNQKGGTEKYGNVSGNIIFIEDPFAAVNRIWNVAMAMVSNPDQKDEYNRIVRNAGEDPVTLEFQELVNNSALVEAFSAQLPPSMRTTVPGQWALLTEDGNYLVLEKFAHTINPELYLMGEALSPLQNLTRETIDNPEAIAAIVSQAHADIRDPLKLEQLKQQVGNKNLQDAADAQLRALSSFYGDTTADAQRLADDEAQRRNQTLTDDAGGFYETQLQDDGGVEVYFKETEPEWDPKQNFYGAGIEGQTRAQNAINQLPPGEREKFQSAFDHTRGTWAIRPVEEPASDVDKEIQTALLAGDFDRAEALDVARDKLTRKRMTQSEAATLVAPYATNPEEFRTWMRGLMASSGQDMPTFTTAGQPGLFQTPIRDAISPQVRALGEARLREQERVVQELINQGASEAEINAARAASGAGLNISYTPSTMADAMKGGPFVEQKLSPEGERLGEDPLAQLPSGVGSIIGDISMGTGVAPQSKLLTYDPYRKENLITDPEILEQMPESFDAANFSKMIRALPYIVKGKGGAPGYTFVPNAEKILGKLGRGEKKTKYNPAATTKERIQGLMDEFGYTRSQAERYDFEQGKQAYKMQQSYQQQGPMRVRYG